MERGVALGSLKDLLMINDARTSILSQRMNGMRHLLKMA
ncbi:MAG: hypothetical protein H6Q63_709 [Firmicutes bacterium]|nr:hypothetical protein [Bacillota bacterium]